MQLKLIVLLIMTECCIHSASAYSGIKRTLYVDSESGSDLNTGLTIKTAWKSLKYAAEQVKPGDHVLVSPGVYRGGIQVNSKGLPEAPIIFEADAVEGSTVITLANDDIRTKRLLWLSENSDRGLFSISCMSGPPARVLYSGIDLFPYGTKDALNSFTTNAGTPGPKHGYYYDSTERKLYVRLHDSGKYGSINPNDHLMAVAPPTGEQRDGTLVSQSYHYGIGVIGAGNAHIIIDGFTFETPGVAGVYSEASYIKIRLSWFKGCRTGVAGNYKDRITTDPKGMDYFSLRYDPAAVDLSASHITIEYCDYHQKPSFDDAQELMLDFKLKTGKKNNDDLMRSFWHRKSEQNGLPIQNITYEIGLAARIGSDWIIRGNNIHDAFEGLSCHSVSASRGLQVEYNVFERLLDNAVETEDHSSNMHIYRNVIVDVFEPVSWQPIRGTPWPYSIYFIENIIYNTPENQNLWRDIGYGGRGVFKVGVKAITWERVPHMIGTQYAPVTVPLDGLIFANNTILFPGGRLITIQGGRDVPVYNVHIINNIIDTEYLLDLNPKLDLPEGHFNFENNIVHFFELNEDSPAGIVAGTKGKITKTPNAGRLDKNFKPLHNDDITNSAISVPHICKKSNIIGAMQPGEEWWPIKVGPQVKGESRN